jgi:hypothetical protein
MNQNPNDAGVIQALLERFNEQRLPRALEMKEKVERGETLESFEVSFLAEVLADARAINSLLERHPEYEPLVTKALGLYKEITEKALANERKA